MLNRIALGAILALGIALRFYHLGFQSFWLDELFTMKECDPSISWKSTWDMVLRVENKSPLYFFMERLMLSVFGFDEFGARILSALAGVLSIYAMYLLGKELLSERLGLISAFLCSFNYFGILHSQDARGYSLLFLFSILSSLYFIKNLRTPSIRYGIWYGLYSLLMLHFHHFAILILFSQAIIGLIFFIKLPPDRTNFLKSFGVSFTIVFLGFASMIPEIIKAGKITSNWVEPAPSDFFKAYFFEFFGNAAILNPVIGVLVLYFFFVFFLNVNKRFASIWEAKGLNFSMFILLLSLPLLFFIPYWYSIYKVPILVIRYLIVALPFIILLIAISINNLSDSLRLSAVILFSYLSLSDILVAKNYYNQPTNTQFRELAQVVKTRSDKNYPLINELTPWLHTYYMDRVGANNKVLSGNKQHLADSLVEVAKSDSLFMGFWIIGAHKDPKITHKKLKVLRSSLLLAYQVDLVDAWAQLYLPKKYLETFPIVLRHDDFTLKNTDDRDTIISVWREDRYSKAIALEKGGYALCLWGQGTSAQNEYPDMSIFVNDKQIGSYIMTEENSLSQEFNFEIETDREVEIRLKMHNDAVIKGQDRNAYVRTIYIKKLKP